MFAYLWLGSPRVQAIGYLGEMRRLWHQPSMNGLQTAVHIGVFPRGAGFDGSVCKAYIRSRQPNQRHTGFPYGRQGEQLAVTVACNQV
jgi:hypothetical protein